ncbi:hypothetical protein HPB50_028532 [Hyalomma asiaticum]|nr:hypothetical protein HPB50_028532 [Hyalomma asiaticum]
MNAAGESAKKRRKQFSLQEKVDLLREIDSGKKQIDLCRKRGIAPSTVATIWKDREKILKLHQKSQLAPTRKRLRLGNFQDVDQAVLTWFKDARLQNIPVSGPMLQEKAREFADALEVTGFDASAGWLFRFRQRNGITWQVVSGDLWTEVEELLPDVSSFDDYVESDSAALTSADMTTEEIVNSVRDVSSDDDDPKRTLYH